MADVSSAAMLVPSQAMNSSNANSNEQNNPRRRNQRRNNNKSNKNGDEGQTPPPAERADSSAAQPPKRNKARRRNKPKLGNGGEKKNGDASQPSSNDQPPRQGDKQGRQTGQTRKKKQQKGSRFPWRKFLNSSSVDPITLEPLNTLSYPPFPLCANAPYIPVPQWPVPKEEKEAPKNAAESEGERQKRVLQEQWGSTPMEVEQEKSETPPPLSERKLNLFDGRALAYYMVSQLQFIDPLNRRDLTRDELVNLDRYLRRAGFNDLNVTEAYDVKGMTMSSAGAAASTDEGRAQIRQQEAQMLAQTLLDSVFAGASVTSRPANPLQAQYAASQRQDQQRQNRNRNNNRSETQEDHGVYGSEEHGLVVIDDDANPGLRGGGGTRANAPSFTPGSLWSASHVTNRYVNHAASVQANNFPALGSASVQPIVQPVRSEAPAPGKKPPSRSLTRITKVVAKTTPKELQKQREARELFVKRAAMSNQAFGVDRSESQAHSGLMLPPSASASSGEPSQGQLLRNQAFASALGVAPSTMRQENYNQGWARPTDTNPELDEFGNELSAANYPDSLIMQARERMGITLKLEKKWATFLTDDTAASLPMNKMDRPLRAFVHTYSDYWKLHTESFDPEPNRYIHCVKLRDTSAPRPLLSEAARKWRGPRPVIVELTDHAVKQTAGQTPREFPPAPEREPLQLKPRSIYANPTPLGYAAQAEAESEAQLNTRSDELFSGRERPKLKLANRTLPTELPRLEKAYGLAEERERQKATREDQLRLERREEEKKRRILESAFASDDEEKSIMSHDSEEWGDLDAEEVYSGSEDEEM